MTYKLNPELRKIQSPVVLVFPDGETREFECGFAVAEADFEQRYLIQAIRALDSIIEIKLIECDSPDMYWAGEAPVSFF